MGQHSLFNGNLSGKKLMERHHPGSLSGVSSGPWALLPLPPQELSDCKEKNLTRELKRASITVWSSVCVISELWRSVALAQPLPCAGGMRNCTSITGETRSGAGGAASSATASASSAASGSGSASAIGSVSVASGSGSGSGSSTGSGSELACASGSGAVSGSGSGSTIASGSGSASGSAAGSASGSASGSTGASSATSASSSAAGAGSCSASACKDPEAGHPRAWLRG